MVELKPANRFENGKKLAIQFDQPSNVSDFLIRRSGVRVTPGALCVGRMATSDEMLDGLLSPRRKFPDKSRKLFRRRSMFLRLSRGRRLDRQRALKVKLDPSSECAAAV